MARAYAIDADAKPIIPQRRQCRCARAILVGGADRVFEVDRDEVRTRRQRLFEALGPTAGHEQQALEGAQMIFP